MLDLHSGGSEVGDLCEATSGTVTTGSGAFRVQGIWDERSMGCKVTTTAAQDFNVALSPNVGALTVGSHGTFSVQTVTTAGFSEPFEIDHFSRESLLNGWDDIGRTLLHDDEITAYEDRRPAFLPRV